VDDATTAGAIRSGEGAIAERAQRGDRDAFTALVDGRLAGTYRTAMAILGNEADARDATQEIFVRAWRNLPELREPDRFGAWFGRIVVNTCRTAIRGRRRRIVREIPVGELPDEGHQLMSLDAGDEGRLRDVDALDRALDRISVADRTLLVLHHFEHLSLEVIGERMGVSSKTVKSRMFSARRSLARAVEVERR
jgi:RNA polymerase sigma-70 factor (ECF subfamily)